MKGDFSRWTFNPNNQFTRVLMQQGRVQLDADWNEQVAILLHTMRQMVSDMMGPHGTWNKTAFQVEETDEGYQVNATGRYYVGGVLIDMANNVDNWPTIKETSGNTLIYLDVWERHLTYVEADKMDQLGLREVALKGADTTTRTKVIWTTNEKRDLEIFQVDRSDDGDTEDLEDEDLLESLTQKKGQINELRKQLQELPNFPADFSYFTALVNKLNEVINAFDSISPIETNDLADNDVYLKEIIDNRLIDRLNVVIERVNDLIGENGRNDTNIPTINAGTMTLHKIYLKSVIDEPIITQLNDIVTALKSIVELANGSAADQTINRIIKQAQLEQLEKEYQDIIKHIEDIIYAYFENIGTTGQVKASTKGGEEPNNTDSCTIPPDAAYTGPENQLYRVEIHKEGSAMEATFKWSRENGTVIFPINPENITRSGKEVTVEVEDFGRDTEARLTLDDWVELVYDDLVEQLVPGQMLQVTAVDTVTGMVALKGNSEVILPDSLEHPIVRRWDQGSEAIPIFNKDKEEDKYSHSLEKGIHIEFEISGTYRTGDYWLIPARTATRDIEWLRDGDGKSEFIEPHGIKHYYAPLAIITGEDIIDCRRVFEQLGQPVLPEPESTPQTSK